MVVVSRDSSLNCGLKYSKVLDSGRFLPKSFLREDSAGKVPSRD